MSTWFDKKQQGNEEFKQKNYLTAIGLYTESINLDPTQDIPFNNRGLCYMNLNKDDKAKLDFERAIQLNPKNVKALKRLSYIHILLGELYESLTYLKRCVELDPKDLTYLNDYKNTEELINIKKEVEILKNNNDNWGKIFELSEKLYNKCKKNFDIKVLYLESLINTYHLERAFSFYNKNFNENEKKNEYVQYLIINANFIDGKYDKTRTNLTDLLSKTNNINIINKIKDFAQKLEIIQKEKENANNCFKINDFDGAIKIYSKLLKFDNNNNIFNALILSNRALCYYKKKDYFEALHDINESIKLNNKYYKSFQRRANINIQLKNSLDAKNDLKKVLELDPYNKDAFKLLKSIEQEEEKNKRRDFYKILEVNKNSTQEEIRKNFKRLAIKWHPDKNNESEEKRIYAEKLFQDINEAYGILSDERKKKLYDSGQHPDDPNSQFHSKEEQERTNNFYNSNYKKSYEKKRERSRDN